MSSEATTEPSSTVEFASKTDVGRVRAANEDSCGTFDRPDGTQLLVVADGMGGHRGGATASSMAVETISEVFENNPSSAPGSMLGEAIETANARVYELAQNDRDLEGMGTTVVAFLLDARGRGTVAHVGDSRAYRYRRGQLEPLTTDHSVVAEMQRRGLISADEAAVHPRRNEILRSVGVSANVEVEVNSVDVAPGDSFLLCSDGLSGVVSDLEIAAVVQSESPHQAVDTLIEQANGRGGPDNITVQILSVPTSDREGDPEATAPVEISEIGIEAIETRRRRRRQVRRFGPIVVIVALAATAYLTWQWYIGAESPSASQRPGASRSGSTIDPGNATRPGAVPSPSAAPADARPALEDQFDADPSAKPRRGIQR